MKIQKFNESNLTTDILDDFMENIMEYFYPGDTGSMGPYHIWLDKKNKNKFNIEFQYLVMDMEDLEKVLKVYEYLKSFDSSSTFYIYAEKIEDEINATCFHINLSVDKFDNMNMDIDKKLELNRDTNKYNL